MRGDDRTVGAADERVNLADALPAYEIGIVLGQGAFAVVYAGHHRELDRAVAIKRLSPALLSDDASRARFRAEARLLAALDHPHVVRVHDYVQTDTVCALVMERLRGGTLADRRRVAPPSRNQACAITLAALHGLEHAHQHGVLHRDIKPENLLFGRDDAVRVADFGIAKMLRTDHVTLTVNDSLLGTPAYMAPEQVDSSIGPLSSATDVWATGAVLYELLTGEPPFPRSDLAETLLRRVRDDPKPARIIAPDLSDDLADVLMRSIARDPQDRYPTAFAFAQALEKASGAEAIATTGIPVHRTPPPPTGGDEPTLAEGAEPQPAARFTSAPSARRRIRGLPARIVVPVVGALAVAAAAFALLQGGGDGDGHAAPPAPPPGWPKTMLFGFLDQVDGPSGVARRVGSAGSTFTGLLGDPASKDNWSRDPEKSPAKFAAAAQRHGVLPYFYYYQLRVLGRTGKDDALAPDLRRTLADTRLMGLYWRNVRRALRSLGKTRKPAAVAIEPGVWALLEQQLLFEGERPHSIPARVSTVLPELRGLPDTIEGVVDGWRVLRDRYAPQVLLGWILNEWGANIDLSKEALPRSTVLSAARKVAEFTVTLGDWDFAGIQIAYSEEGRNPSRLEVFSTSEKEAMLTFIREFVRISRIPAVLDSVPLGNTVMKTISDEEFHWRDSWVQWLMGDDEFTGLTKLRDAGVIGVVFGVGQGPDETCPCDAAKDGVTNAGKRGRVATSADDDGGYLAERMAALERSGGMSLTR